LHPDSTTARVRLTVLAVIDHYGPSSARRLRSTVAMRAGVDLSLNAIEDVVGRLTRAGLIEAQDGGLLSLTAQGAEALSLFGGLLEEELRREG
jgi:predicted transcriptional regulator